MEKKRKDINRSLGIFMGKRVTVFDYMTNLRIRSSFYLDLRLLHKLFDRFLIFCVKGLQEGLVVPVGIKLSIHDEV